MTFLPFKELLKEYLTYRRPKSPNSFHPHTLGTSCLRKLYLTQTQPAEFSPETLEIFEEGTNIHEWMQRFFMWLSSQNKGLKLKDIEKAVKVKVPGEGWEISGKIDALVQDVRTGEPYVVEIKSARSLEYIRNREEAQHHHQVQANIYCYMENVDKYLVFYVDKPTFRKKFQNGEIDIKVFEGRYNHDLLLKTVDKIRTVWQFIKNNQLPPVIEDPGWECDFCPFAGKGCDYPLKRSDDGFNR